MSHVSFVIPAYNSHATIQECVRSIVSQTQKDKILEIFIVDSSEDRNIHAQLGLNDCEKIQCIQLTEKTGPAQARNIGAKKAQGDLLCFIDSDAYLEPDWLETILDVFNEGKFVGCGSISIAKHQESNYLCLAQHYLQFNEFLDVGKTRSKKFVPGCNIFCERTIFESVGGFPEIRAAEDVLFCLSVGETHPIWLIPSAKAYHIFREHRKGFLENQRLLGEYVIRYRRQKFARWYYRGLIPIFLFPAFLAIKVTRIELRIISSGLHHFSMHCKSWPMFFQGMVAWSQGFVRGCWQT